MTYQPTTDAAKAAAEVLFTAAYRNGYDISSRVALSGKGIKQINGSNYHVTDAAADRIKASHTWACDF